MLGRWMTDLETLEAIRSDADALELVLRLAAMSKAGTLQPFVAEMHEADVDEETLTSVAELAEDESFLLAVEDYVSRTSVAH
jgi:hypothetical protein